MANTKENLKALFANTRSRIIILFTAALLIAGVIVGIIKLSGITRTTLPATANITHAPTGIQSIPGALNPTEQYAKLQQTQNVQQASDAIRTGRSAIPTIIRSQAFGHGVESVGAAGGKGGVGFQTLAREEGGGNPKDLWLQTLKNANCSAKSVQEVTQQGAQLTDLRAACSCAQLHAVGYTLADLNHVCSCVDLKALGFNASQLKNVGYDAERLRLCGFSACQEKAAGFTAQQMQDGGFTDGELKGAGFTPSEIQETAALPEGITDRDVSQADCNPQNLAKLRAAGVSALAIRQINGCSAKILKEAGFTAKDLRDAGFTAAQLKNAGFTPQELRAAGYTPRSLLNAGFTPAQLSAAGYTPSEIKAAEMELPPGITPEAVKAAGCNVGALIRERKAGVSAALIHQYAGCSAKALKAAGFTDGDLANAGFTPAEIAASGTPGFTLPPGVTTAEIKAAACDPTKLAALRAKGVSAKTIRDLNGCSVDALKAAGFDAKALKAAGFTDGELANAGFTPAEIAASGPAGFTLPPGVTAAEIKAADCNPTKLAALRVKGVSAKAIRDLNGCSNDALKAAGFTPEQIAAAGGEAIPSGIDLPKGITDADIKAAGCDVAKLQALRAKGVSARAIHELNGCSAAALKAAGYDARQLSDAGFTPDELLKAGFTPNELVAAGLNPSAGIAAGRDANCSATSLSADHAMGVSAATIKQTLGCSASQLKAAGYTAKQLKDAGFTAAELKNAGFTAAQLKAAGFTAKQLKAAGFTARQLKDAGFSAKELKAAGFSAAALKDAGFTAKELKDAGFSAKQLKDAGFTARQLKDAGFSASELKDAGFSASALKDAGFSASELKAAGFNAKELHDAGFTAQQLQKAGFSPDQIKNAGYTDGQLREAGMAGPLQLSGGMPSVAGPAQNAQAEATNNQLQNLLKQQQEDLARQRYQQRIQQRSGAMQQAASQLIGSWKTVPGQVYVAGSGPKPVAGDETRSNVIDSGVTNNLLANPRQAGPGINAKPAIIKTGDVLFAVIDTAINSDEPGPILATIVSGKLAGTTLIGSFNLPSNADKLVISFNTMSVPGAPHSVGISAFAIDPDTARTALASTVNKHYLTRYGALFASTFIEGFGNAFQSANTTISIGGTGGVTNTTVQSGVGRSILENAVIGLATVGKSWGQVAQQEFNRPTTVQVCSGTAIGVLFTQDITTL